MRKQSSRFGTEIYSETVNKVSSVASAGPSQELCGLLAAFTGQQHEQPAPAVLEQRGLLNLAAASLPKLCVCLSCPCQVDLSSRPFRLYTDQKEVTADTVIIATGAVAKRMDFPGSDEANGFW